MGVALCSVIFGARKRSEHFESCLDAYFVEYGGIC